MKKLIIILVLGLVSCNEVNTPKKQTGYVVRADSNPLEIVIADSCEYLLVPWGNATVLTHKGDCKSCRKYLNNLTHD